MNIYIYTYYGKTIYIQVDVQPEPHPSTSKFGLCLVSSLWTTWNMQGSFSAPTLTRTHVDYSMYYSRANVRLENGP